MDKLKIVVSNNITFVKEDLINNLTINTKNLDQLLDMIILEQYERQILDYLFNIMKRLPASITGYHGPYDGGLYDHVLLVANFSLKFAEIINSNISIDNMLKAALYHDFGKVVSYCPKRDIELKYYITKTDLTRINSYINTKYDLKGYDKHIDQCIALIRKARLKINREIELGIIFHHGGWSRYKPHNTKGLPALLHSADMLASQVLGV